MWEISEGDIKFLYAMKLVPIDDRLGFWESKVSMPETLNASSVQFLDDRRCLGRHGLKRRKNFFELTKIHYTLYKHLRTCTNFLEMYGK